MASVTIRMILFVGILVYFSIVIYLLRGKRMDLKYTLLWLLIGVLMLVLVLAPSVLTVISQMLNISNEMYALFTIALASLTIIQISLTSIVSKQKDEMKRLIQSYGRLEKRVRELEAQKEEKHE